MDLVKLFPVIDTYTLKTILSVKSEHQGMLAVSAATIWLLEFSGSCGSPAPEKANSITADKSKHSVAQSCTPALWLTAVRLPCEKHQKRETRPELGWAAKTVNPHEGCRSDWRDFRFGPSLHRHNHKLTIRLYLLQVKAGRLERMGWLGDRWH